MSRQRRILVYGNSLVLGGIAASLLAENRFQVVRLPQPLLNMSDVEALAADVVIFDTEAPGSAEVFAALAGQPELLLLGVSPDKNIVRLWSAQEHRELSIGDLTALIEADPQSKFSTNSDALITQDS